MLRISAMRAAALLATISLGFWQDEARAMETDFGDPIGNYNFRVEIDGVSAGAFKNVEGLDSETEIVEFQDGADIILRKKKGNWRTAGVELSGSWSPKRKVFIDWQESNSSKTKKKQKLERDLRLTLVETVSRKGEPRARCTMVLHRARLHSLKVRTTKKGKTVRKQLTAVVRPRRITHSCAELFKPPRERKK